MALSLTDDANRASTQSAIEPILVLQLDGVSTIYGARIVSKRIKVGEPGLKVGGGWKIGGLNKVADQADLITLANGTTTSIKQQLAPDKGQGSGISSITISLVDRGGAITRLVSPSIVVPEIMGLKAKVYLGFKDVAFPSDYTVVFRGIIDDVQVGQGNVLVTISAPDVKKKQTLFAAAKMKLQSAISATSVASDTGFFVDDNSDFISTAPHLSLAYTTPFLRKYVLIDDEVMEVNGPTDAPYHNDVGRVWERGSLGSTVAAHALQADVTSLYRLKSDVMDLALRLMLSDAEVTPMFRMTPTSFGYFTATESHKDAIWFEGVDLYNDYSLRVGDFWINYQPNQTATEYQVRRALVPTPEAQIKGIEVRPTGTLVYVGGDFTLNPVFQTPFPVPFVNQFNTLGYGCGLDADEVDVEQHLKLQRQFLSGFVLDCYFKDETNMKDYIEQNIYAVCGCYSIPRKGKASVGYHIGAVPGNVIKTLSIDNVKAPSAIKVRRSLSNNFLNTVVTKFDLDFKTDAFNSGDITLSQASLSRIPVGTKAQVIEAPGLRPSLNGSNLAQQTAKRLLKRYGNAAEYMENVSVIFSVGYTIEIGDIVYVDGASLNLLNSYAGDRSPALRLYEVANKTMDLRTGDIKLSLVDTNYATGTRYGLIAPASKITAVGSATQITVGPLYSSTVYGTNEGGKWSRYVTAQATIGVKIRSPDSTTRYAQTTIALSGVSGNVITLASLPFTPQVGDILELADYDFASTTDQMRSTYAFMTDTDFFDSGSPYQMV